jgi:hypothetical protein
MHGFGKSSGTAYLARSHNRPEINPVKRRFAAALATQNESAKNQ